MDKYLFAILVAFVSIIGGALGGYFVGYDIGLERAKEQTPIVSFDQCVAAGYPIMDSYPEQCMTPDGQVFVKEISEILPPEPIEEGVFCTMDAKLCDDGSSVGRVPPSCEFAPCPED